MSWIIDAMAIVLVTVVTVMSDLAIAVVVGDSLQRALRERH